MSGFPTAKKWGFVKEIPISTTPTEKYKKRKAWSSKEVFNNLAKIKDKGLHLAVHLAFVCSLRAGEVAGIDLRSVDLEDQSLWIMQEAQSISDRALEILPRNEFTHLFPKQSFSSKSNLILKLPKTEESYRKVYLTNPYAMRYASKLRGLRKRRNTGGLATIDTICSCADLTDFR